MKKFHMMTDHPLLRTGEGQDSDWLNEEIGANLHISHQYQAVLLSHTHLDNRVCIEFEVWQHKRL